ncbi:MAG: hypothetical protein HY553_06140 [Elusimicrobia bacterium]|nr:hypothetical protein [Elusimicrobiota bacterium]
MNLDRLAGPKPRLLAFAVALLLAPSPGRALGDTAAIGAALRSSGLVSGDAVPAAFGKDAAGGGARSRLPALLQSAVALRQGLVGYLEQNARLVSKEQVGSFEMWFGLFSGRGEGAIYDNMLKGSRVYALSEGLSTEARRLAAELDPLDTWRCPTWLRAQLHRFIVTPGIPAFDQGLADFREAMNALELEFVGQEAHPSFKTFEELKSWAHSTVIVKGRLELKLKDYSIGTSRGGVLFLSSRRSVEFKDDAAGAGSVGCGTVNQESDHIISDRDLQTIFGRVFSLKQAYAVVW